MKPSTIKYFFRESFSGLKKNMLMTMASMVAVAACISILSFSYCVGSNLQYMLDQMEDSIGISVFLKGELTGEEIEKMKEEIGQIDHVEGVEYISPADALDDLKQDWGAEEDIFIGLDEENNPLSHSFQISLDKIENQNGVLTALENVDGIDNVRHGQTETELLMKANKIFSAASVVVMVLLGVISIMIIMNTIRISVVNRRIEINIMKYVGATDWFIRWPFIIEGIIIGLVGAVVPLVIGFPIYAKITSAIFEYLPMITFIQFKLTGDVFGFLFPFGILFGIALGVIGSVTSIRKHLRV
ncbi:MAG: permease-like cell division protein FtsX [Anaerotignum sp.]|nr:permease-like cell division protein FtsX [Anaerotignum sp.]MBR3992732.1 permease-like cell division protein FtsX [Anaerotignum sp.]